jgi:hypothetical protein
LGRWTQISDALVTPEALVVVLACFELFAGTSANLLFFTPCQARNAAPAVTGMQARFYADKASPTEVSSILEQRIRGVQEESGLAETGRVLSVGYVELQTQEIGQPRPV